MERSEDRWEECHRNHLSFIVNKDAALCQRNNVERFSTESRGYAVVAKGRNVGDFRRLVTTAHGTREYHTPAFVSGPSVEDSFSLCQGETWSAFISLCAIRTGGPPTPIAHNIPNPIPSSPSSPHPLATASSSGALLSETAFPTCVVTPPIASGAG